MKRETSVNRAWRVIIAGGGFGGLRAAKVLKSDLFDVTLIVCELFVNRPLYA
jgi:NADH dehydrogenase FAD-containing subunit